MSNHESSDESVHSVSKLNQMILNPNDILEQANAVRGMILAIDALLNKGLLSLEVADFLNSQYSRMLDKLWLQDKLVAKYDSVAPIVQSEVGEKIQRDFNIENYLAELRPPESPLMSNEQIMNTLKNHILTQPVPKEYQNCVDNKKEEVNDRNHTESHSKGSGTGFASAKSVLLGSGGVVPPPAVEIGVDDKVFEICSHPELAGIEPELAKIILNDMMTENPKLSWEDIAGLEYAKKAVNEMVVWPLLRPDIFTGPREPPKAMLLFGPPGTGKTLIGKCIASQANATFFSVSASSLASKWLGESEKLVRTLFAVARAKQPSVVFFDELDSLLSKRDGSHGSDRKVKTEFFVQLDGARVHAKNQVVVIGATNRPYDLDEAARRRLVKRIYIALPNRQAREAIIQNMLKSTRHSLTDDQLGIIANTTSGYSGADMANLCREAALSPVRECAGNLTSLSLDEIRAVSFEDLTNALNIVKSTVSPEDLTVYEDWNRQFGCCQADSFD